MEVEGGGLRWRVVEVPGGGGWWIEVEDGGGWWIEVEGGGSAGRWRVVD